MLVNHPSFQVSSSDRVDELLTPHLRHTGFLIFLLLMSYIPSAF